MFGKRKLRERLSEAEIIRDSYKKQLEEQLQKNQEFQQEGGSHVFGVRRKDKSTEYEVSFSVKLGAKINHGLSFTSITSSENEEILAVFTQGETVYFKGTRKI